MKIVQLIQGTPNWHAHRAQHFNASDAPAMLGCSPYKTRAQLIREIATGVAAEVDDATQARFDSGHRAEALARPLAEKIIGEELFPCVGVADAGPYSASFDGLTLMEDVAFEHKSLNDDLRDVFADIDTMAPKYRESESAGRLLPKHYRVQMEQQCMVSGAPRVLFMASKWDGDGNLIEERHCWYESDADLRAVIIAGWQQFAVDVAAYVPEAAAAPAAVGRAPDQLPALHIEVTGMVTASNLREWKDAAIAVFQGIGTDLQTDQDFADAERTVKWCGDIEDQLKAAKAHALGQTASIDELFRTIDAISEEARAKRLQLDKLVKQRKEAIRGEIVDAGRNAVQAHYDAINATLGQHALAFPAREIVADLGGAIKGKKSVASMRDAVDAAVANAKVAASTQALRVAANLSILAEHPDHATLFADRVQLCATKQPEDLRNLVAARIAEHDQREAARLEQERERIRQEEVERIERERAAEEVAEQKQAAAAAIEQDTPKGDEASAAAEPATQRATPAPLQTGAARMPVGARMKLGDINAAITPLSITADGLATLGFKPVASRGAAKMYAATDFPAICGALSQVIAKASVRAADFSEAA